MPIDGESRVGFMAGEHLIHGLPCDLQRRIIQGTLGKHLRITCSLQQDITVSQRNRQLLGQAQHHLAARL